MNEYILSLIKKNRITNYWWFVPALDQIWFMKYLSAVVTHAKTFVISFVDGRVEVYLWGWLLW